MKGLLIWAQSDCRSTMGLYDAVIRQLDVPFAVALWFYRKTETYVDNRMEVGFSNKEFEQIPMIPVGEDYEKGLRVLDGHPGYTHIFTVFQNSPAWRRLIVEAKRRGEKVVVACESPCNMEKGFRKLLKEVYLRFVLRWKSRTVIKAAECFVNFSGNDDKYARMIGWPKEKIIPFGYFPPPIPGSKCVRRTTNKPFHILSTGILSMYRGADVLVDALRILKDRGVPYTATITQKGELLESLKATARRHQLPIEFAGFVEMSKLIELYETCSVYVGAGRHEPWGMRLNDVLQCGAPLVVSRGMGGVKMVDDYGCGLAFENEDARDLARQLERLATDNDLYGDCASKAVQCAQMCSPENKAFELSGLIKERLPSWVK